MSAVRQFLVWREGETTFRVSIAHLTHVVFTDSNTVGEKMLKLFIVGSGQEVHALTGQSAAEVYQQLPAEFHEVP